MLAHRLAREVPYNQTRMKKPAALRKHVEKLTAAWLPALRRHVSSRLVWSFVIFLFVARLFAAIAKQVRDNDTLRFDEWVLYHIHAISRPGLDGVVTALTQLGGVMVVPLVSLAVAAWLYKKASREHAWLVLAGVIGSSLLNLALKSLFARSRPDLWDHLVVERSFSFPSGHAMASMSLAASIVAALWFSRWRKVAISLGMVYITAVGFTRLYLGVHYPTDILAGWVIALGWVALVWVIFADAPKTKDVITSPEPVRDLTQKT